MAGRTSSLKRRRTDSPSSSAKKPKLTVPANYIKDGSTIYLTPIDYLSSKPTHMLTLRQLLYEDLLSDEGETRTLQAALMTTYCHEDEFIAPIVQSGVKFCLLTDGGRGHGKIQKISDSFTVIFPKNSVSWGKFHPKLFLLKFPNALRVVVTSANLLKHDWSEIGQVVWFQDFPRGAASGEFYDTLQAFLTEMVPKTFSLSSELELDLSEYDFSTAKVKLVFSVPGRYTNISNYGQGRMRAILKETGQTYTYVSFQNSSISGISDSFLTQLKSSFANNPDCELNLIFPTLSRVQKCHNGLDAGLTTFLNESMYNSAAFPKSSLRRLDDPVDYPEVTGHVSHSKVLIVSNGPEIRDDSILYFGSHNLSSSAWGKLEKGGSQIFMGNYELGVVFGPASGSAEMKNTMVSRLPFKYPADKYGETDQPWMIDIHYQDPE